METSLLLAHGVMDLDYVPKLIYNVQSPYDTRSPSPVISIMTSEQVLAHQYHLRSRQKDTVASTIMSPSPERHYQPHIMDDFHLTEDHTTVVATDPLDTEDYRTFLPTGHEGVYSLESIPTLTNHTSPVTSMDDLEELLQQPDTSHPWPVDFIGAHHLDHYPQGSPSQTFLDPRQIHMPCTLIPNEHANSYAYTEETTYPTQPPTPIVLIADPTTQYDEDQLHCYACGISFRIPTDFK